MGSDLNRDVHDFEISRGQAAVELLRKIIEFSVQPEEFRALAEVPLILIEEAKDIVGGDLMRGLKRKPEAKKPALCEFNWTTEDDMPIHCPAPKHECRESAALDHYRHYCRWCSLGEFEKGVETK